MAGAGPQSEGPHSGGLVAGLQLGLHSHSGPPMHAGQTWGTSHWQSERPLHACSSSAEQSGGCLVWQLNGQAGHSCPAGQAIAGQAP